MTVTYKHTQIGYTLVVVYSSLILLLLLLNVAMWFPPFGFAALIFLLLVLPTFATLTVTVSDGKLKLRFGWGLIRKRIPLEEIEAVQPVKNPWWYLLGVRYTPRGWLYAVSGQSAIELQFRDGRTMRVGTDEPEQLSRALARAVASG